LRRPQRRQRPRESLRLLGCATACPFLSCYVADIVAEGKVIVEIKACQALDESHDAQILNYLEATAIEVGLLVNFGPEIDIQRRIFTP
jgi:GxxExxY protein